MENKLPSQTESNKDFSLKRPRQPSQYDEDLLREEFANKFTIACSKNGTMDMDCYVE
jgi:hypothetical protein